MKFCFTTFVDIPTVLKKKKTSMNPKILQYLMGHSEISVYSKRIHAS